MVPFRRSLAVLAIIHWIAFVGCGYNEIGAPAFELSKAVYNVCNSREAAQLENARAIIAEHHQSGMITDEENRYLGDILDLAENGDWDKAERNARELLSDQTDW